MPYGSSRGLHMMTIAECTDRRSGWAWHGVLATVANSSGLFSRGRGPAATAWGDCQCSSYLCGWRVKYSNFNLGEERRYSVTCRGAGRYQTTACHTWDLGGWLDSSVSGDRTLACCGCATADIVITAIVGFCVDTPQPALWSAGFAAVQLTATGAVFMPSA